MIVQDILVSKGREVFSIGKNATVYDAVSIMSAKNIGALLVLEASDLIGIISDRDYRDKVVLKGRTSLETHVLEIMTPNPITVSPSESIEFCMAIMTEKKIRHLPVLQDSRIEGVVSIGDMVKAIIDKQKLEINDLKNYITGTYPG